MIKKGTKVRILNSNGAPCKPGDTAIIDSRSICNGKPEKEDGRAVYKATLPDCPRQTWFFTTRHFEVME